MTAFWLNDVVIKQQLFPPTTALHLPLPFSDDNRPCHKMTMSVSAFEGDDRIKVKAMIEQLGDILVAYFCFCKYLLYLSLWYRNTKLTNKFHLPNITEKLTGLHKNISETAYQRLSPLHGFIRLFLQFYIFNVIVV